MRNNIGKQVKKVTLIIPESVEIIDITYYWKTSMGNTLKTQTTLMDENCRDGNEAVCFLFPEENGGEP